MIQHIMEKTVHFTIQYDRPSSPFSEFPVRTVMFPERHQFDKELERLQKDPELRILRAWRQETTFVKEYIIADS